MSKIIFFISLLFLPIRIAWATEMWLENISVAQLLEIYQKINYLEDSDIYAIPQKIPPIYLKNFPADFNHITDKEQRNRLFIKILAPLTLKLNDTILNERSQIIKLYNQHSSSQPLTAKQLELIEKKAQKYDVFTPEKGSKRTIILLDELLKRIDAIPPSIMITIAAIETDFGSSRIVNQGNSLYKILEWHTNKGLKPIGETEDDSYRIKTYPDIFQSMLDFALQINSSPDFNFLRMARDTSRNPKNNKPLGYDYAAYAFTNSPLPNYAGIIDYTLSYYTLSNIDRATLDLTPITAEIVKKYSKYLAKKIN